MLGTWEKDPQLVGGGVGDMKGRREKKKRLMPGSRLVEGASLPRGSHKEEWLVGTVGVEVGGRGPAPHPLSPTRALGPHAQFLSWVSQDIQGRGLLVSRV